MEDIEQILIERKLKSSKIGKPGTQRQGPGSTYMFNFEFVVNDDIYFMDQLHGYI